MSVTNEDFDQLALAQLKERKTAMGHQASISAEFRHLGGTLSGLASSLQGEEISPAQVLDYIEAMSARSPLIDASALATEVQEFQARKQRIAELNAALSQYL
jgi:hypothetical protein